MNARDPNFDLTLQVSEFEDCFERQRRAYLV